MELVLQESAIDAIGFAQRDKGGGWLDLLHGAGTSTQTGAIRELLRLGQPEAVKEVEIKGVAVFSEIGADAMIV